MKKGNNYVEPKTEEGRWLRSRRLALGLSQGVLAAQLGVNRRTLSDWEAGRHPLPYRDRLEQVFGLLVPSVDDAALQMRHTLKLRREALGIGQAELARMLRISQHILMTWERGNQPIPERMVPEIGQVLTRAAPSARIISDHHTQPASEEWHATLRARRKASGVTLAYLAGLIGCGTATLGVWETGRRRTNAATAARVDAILAKLGVPGQDAPIAAQDEAEVPSPPKAVSGAILTPLAPVARRRAPQRPTSSVVLFPSRASGSSSA